MVASRASALDLSQLPAAYIDAAHMTAERHVRLLVDGLTRLGSRTGRDSPVSIPAPLLLELAAAFQLEAWEQQGFTEHVASGLPDAATAFRELARRCVDAPMEFATASLASLSLRVLNFQLQRFAWAGQELLAADIRLSDQDDDHVLDSLVDFLWSHRHELSQILDCCPRSPE
ncbi:MAG: hypothetical protein KDA75_18460 [Planctomycetaceae bacterium]|nr:hypothetical protein [Planctomycetaceae bacterium]